jgi:hypothetical protein
MPTLRETVEGVSLDPGVATSLGDAFSALGERTLPMPAQVPQLLEAAGRLELPAGPALLGDAVGGLSALVAEGPGAADGVWGSLTGGLGRLEESLGTGVGDAIAAPFDRVRSLSDALPVDPSLLLAALEVPLREAVGVLGERPELTKLQELVAKVQELKATLEAAPAQLAALVQEQIDAAIAEATAVLEPVIRQLDGLLELAEGHAATAALEARLAALVDRVVPPSGPTLPERVAALDLADADAGAELEAELRAAAAGLGAFGVDAERGLAAAAELLALFDPAPWGQRMVSAAEQAAALQIEDVTAILAQWRAALEDARELVAGIAADELLAPVRELAEQVGPLVEQLGLDALEDALAVPVGSARQAAQGVQDLQIDVLAGARSLAAQITDALDAIDLDAVATAVANALGVVDDAIAEIEGLAGAAATELAAGLETLTDDLGALRTDLTDPQGSLRAPIEGFLATIRDAIPDDIAGQLNAAGETIGEAVASLEGLAIEPAFDAVIAELGEMRDELNAIDPGALNDLFRAALKAAFDAIFETFDFDQMVKDAITEAYDEAVADFAEPAIDVLQQELDGILAFVRANDPATLLGRLGLEEAYAQMVAGASALQPSALLAPVLADVRAAAGRLDGFAPSAALAPLTEPLSGLGRLIDEISPEPVFAALGEALDRVAALVAELDLEPLVGELDAAVGRVRAQLEAMLVVDGLLEPLRPVHAAVMDALEVVDPSVLLAPVVDFRQTLLDAIEAVDLSVLSTVLTAIAARIDAVELPELRDRLGGRARALAAALAALDLPARTQRLRTEQAAIQAALEARGPQADAAAEARRRALLDAAESLDPLLLLAGPLGAARRSQDALAVLIPGLDTTLADGGPLEAPLAALAERLRGLGLGITAGPDGVQDALTALVEEAFAQLGLTEIEALFAQVRSTFESFGPDALEAQLEALLEPVRDVIDAIPQPSALLAPVFAEFDALKALVDPGLRDFLDALKAEVEPVFDTARAKLDAVDVTALTAQLDEQYAEIQALKDRLLATLDELAGALDEPYAAVVALLDGLNPGVVLVEPLQATYEQILAKVDGISVRTVFQPLLDAVAGLRDELLAQIDRTAAALQEMLAASPVAVEAGV